MVYTPKTNNHARQASCHGDEICVAIAVDSFSTIARPIRQDDRMLVVYVAIDKVEDISKENRCKGHAAPVLAQASHAKGLGNE